MNSLTKDSAKVEQESTAQANNPDILESAFTSKSVFEIGSDDRDKILLFSRELAVALNPQRPDFNGALIIYGLYLWQQTRLAPFAYVPKVNDLRGSYRSLSELRGEYPWLSEEGIRKILRRAAKRLPGLFVLDDSNPGATRGKLHFWISPQLIKAYRFNKNETPDLKNNGLIGVLSSDAVAYGVLEGLLLHNLRYVTADEHNVAPVVDEEGNIFRELSPTTLTEPRVSKYGKPLKPILPTSRKSVSAALKNLKEAQAIEEHSIKSGFYRPLYPAKSAELSVTKVAGAVTIVASRVTKVASAVTIVARRNEGIARKACASNALEPMPKTSIDNTDGNTNEKTDRKCVIAPTAPLRSTVVASSFARSAGATKLMELINAHLESHRQSSLVPPISISGKEYEVFQVNDYDDLRQCGYDDFYQSFPLQWYSGKPYCRRTEVEHYMEEMLSRFDVNSFPYTPKNADDLKALFLEHPALSAEHLLELFFYLPPYSLNLGDCPTPKKGHDHWYFARRITSLEQFLRYLPQLAREYYVFEMHMSDGVAWQREYDDKGRPVCDYADMPEPYLTLAFENETALPVTQKLEQDEDGELIYRNIFYPEFVGLPTKEIVKIECNPVVGA